MLVLGTIRLACSLAVHYERQHGSVEDGQKLGKQAEHSMINGMVSLLDPASEYASHAVILICEKGTNDSHLFLAALDTLISIVTDPISPLRRWRRVRLRIAFTCRLSSHRDVEERSETSVQFHR